MTNGGNNTVREFSPAGADLGTFATAGNTPFGIALSTNAANVVAGNFIGTDATGTTAVANHTGVTITGSAGNLIGGGPVQQQVATGGQLNRPSWLATAANGDLYALQYPSYGNGAIVQVDPFTGNQTLISSGGLLFAPVGMVLDTDGDLYVTNLATGVGGASPGDVVRVDPATGTQTVVATGGTGQLDNNMGPLAVAPGGNLYVETYTNSGTGAIVALDPVHGTQTLIASGGHLQFLQAGIAVAADGSIYVANDNGGGVAPNIIRIDPTTGAQTVVSSGGYLNTPGQLLVGANGMLFVADAGLQGGIIRINPASGQQGIVSAQGDFSSPTGIAKASGADFFVADQTAFGGTGGIVRVMRAVARNIISGNIADGIDITGTGASGNTIQANVIGLAKGGTTEVGGQNYGINVGSSANTIADNVIAGSHSYGIVVTGTNNLLASNLIGTDYTGTVSLGNGFGIDLDATAVGNTVANNIVAGNAGDGIDVYGSNNILQGNLIGTNAASATDLGNGGDGIQLYGSSATGNLIGGTTAAARNIISGNAGSGVEMNSSGAVGNTVEGNFIGTNIAGTAALDNADDGVAIDGDSNGNTVGGATAGAGNLISGNHAGGVFVASSGNTVAGNFIGTDLTGTLAIPNIGDGINVYGSGNTIGGTTSSAAAVIAPGVGSLAGASAGLRGQPHRRQHRQRRGNLRRTAQLARRQLHRRRARRADGPGQPAQRRSRRKRRHAQRHRRHGARRGQPH